MIDVIWVAQAVDKTDLTRQRVNEARGILERISDSLFSAESIIVFIITFVAAFLLGRLIANILRRVTKYIGAVADKTEDLGRVNQLRRLETLIVLSIAAIKTLLMLFAIYLWWVLTHENQQSTAILGASAILTILLSGALFNTLRDIASGSVMMAEQWFGVGDHIRIEPFSDAQGIVERVTLRSTKIRKVTGEVLWVNNKDIAGVSIAPKGVRTIAIELFAKDEDKATDLIEETNIRLPQGALGAVSPLTIMTIAKIGHNLWHLTAISEVAPGREWLLDKFAIDVLKELDEKRKILVHEPISRYADNEAERRFARTINNARKSRIEHQGRVGKAVKKRVAKARLMHEKATAGKAHKSKSKSSN